MIKYLGSKRALVGVLGAVAEATGARTAVDLFTGTTRVAQEFKRRGIEVTAVDLASYSAVLAECYIAADADAVDTAELDAVLTELNALPGRPGYVTRHFCEQARYFQPQNGARIDAIRDRLETHHRDSPLYPILLTSLMLAADRVDSTTGVQMAYLKQWAERSYRDLELRRPQLLPGTGRSLHGDALALAPGLPRTELAYLDPPYNQHRYYTNYHIWETLVRWDAPEAYGIARKRIDSRDPATRSVFNRKREMPAALAGLIAAVRADTVVLSYNDESWVAPEQLLTALREAGHEEARLVAFDFKRYVGAQIGIHNRRGERVGKVSHLRNTEYLFIAGDPEPVAAAVAAATAQAGQPSKRASQTAGS